MFQNTVSDLAILMVVAVFVMYVILAILYESYLHPITVLSSLPVALLGGLLTLWMFGAEASLYAYIGMFMLMGIVKKNGIMIVDFAEQRVRQGIADDQAIHDASMERFRPIMMTTAGSAAGRASDRAGLRRRRIVAPAVGSGRGRRPDCFAVHHSVCNTGDLSLPGGIPGKGAGPRTFPALDAKARTAGDPGIRAAGRKWRLIP